MNGTFYAYSLMPDKVKTSPFFFSTSLKFFFSVWFAEVSPKCSFFSVCLVAISGIANTTNYCTQLTHTYKQKTAHFSATQFKKLFICVYREREKNVAIDRRQWWSFRHWNSHSVRRAHYNVLEHMRAIDVAPGASSNPNISFVIYLLCCNAQFSSFFRATIKRKTNNNKMCRALFFCAFSVCWRAQRFGFLFRLLLCLSLHH